MNLTENQIDALTAFAQGDEFATEQEVREYFTVASMREMFGRDPGYTPPTQEQLNEMAAAVIANRWHMAEPPPVMVEVASADETIRICGGLDEFAGLEHTAMPEACEAYHRAATDSLMAAGGRLQWCVPRGQRVLHSAWAGSRFAYAVGALGTMAADLTDAEREAIGAAHDAGLAAARSVIEQADAAEAK